MSATPNSGHQEVARDVRFVPIADIARAYSITSSARPRSGSDAAMRAPSRFLD